MAEDTTRTPGADTAPASTPPTPAHAAPVEDQAAVEGTPSAAAGVGVDTVADDEDHAERLGAGDIDVVAVASVRADGTPDQTPGYEKIAGVARRGGQDVETR